MWITRREIARLERELSIALQRATSAESALAAERQRHDWLTLQLTNRVVTKHGGYALEHEKPVDAPDLKAPSREPSLEDYDRLDYYKQCYRNAGMDEGIAQARWDAEMRGEFVPLEVDQTEVEQ